MTTGADELYCSHCLKPSGKYVVSTLQDVSKCAEGFGIFNQDGKLVCDEALPANTDSLPEGSYIFSCHGCTVTDRILKCTDCIDGVGTRHHSEMELRGCCEVGNEAGKLVCDRPGDCYYDDLAQEPEECSAGDAAPPPEDELEYLPDRPLDVVHEESEPLHVIDAETGEELGGLGRRTLEDSNLHSAPRDHSEL